MPEKSWRRYLTAAENRDSFYTREMPKRGDQTVVPPHPKLTLELVTGFEVRLGSQTTRSFRDQISIARYSTDQRADLELYGREWIEPSAHFDKLMADFRAELEVAMRDAMPWDGEL